MLPLNKDLCKFDVLYCVWRVIHLPLGKFVDFWPNLIMAAQNALKIFQVRSEKKIIQGLRDLLSQSEQLVIIEKMLI